MVGHRVALSFLLLGAPLLSQQRLSLDGAWEIAKVGGDGALGAFAPITVPAAFETALGTTFDGVAVYRRTLPKLAAGGAVRLEFAAVATHATVTVNGTPLGEHLGGWTPFRVDASAPLRRDGTDVLEVRVDERVGHNTQGFLPIVQPHFGGIWQGVTLCVDQAPTIDRLNWHAFGAYRPMRYGNPAGALHYEFDVLPSGDRACVAEVELLDGPQVVVHARHEVPVAGGRVVGDLDAEVRAWSPAAPHLHTLRIRLLDGERAFDAFETRVGFRHMAAEGTQVLWNGSPFAMRGVLHWGYSPPHLAPPVDPAFWRAQLLAFQSLGFNTLKCCLWVPPRCVYELCDELGLVVWQEYPTWHPQMDQAHKQELLVEYGEFFVHDRRHASVAFRSITCETGHGADLDVVKALYAACKAAVPDTLVVDDSSWIGWQRIADFWDEHPYGNNSWWPGRLAEFQRHIDRAGKKPLLLGECIAADTWVDATAFRAAHGESTPWWQPECWNAQQAAETWLRSAYGDDVLRSLRATSLDFGLQNRKFQIEQLRMTLPDAGYVVSVARDVPKARMGLFDDLDRPKWPAGAWSWHTDTMLCLDRPWHGRAFGSGEAAPSVRIAHGGTGALDGQLRLSLQSPEAPARTHPVRAEAGGVTTPAAFPALPVLSRDEGPRRVRLTAELAGSHRASNHWDVWLLPPFERQASDVLHVDALTPELLDRLAAGARVVLHAGPRPGSLRSEALWFLRGAPFAPPHPLHARVPADLLLELSSFDLESGHVLPIDALRDEIDPMLAFWETHDIAEVRMHLLAGDTRVGDGRLCVTSLRLDEGTPLGVWLRQELDRHLTQGPAPRRALSPASLARMRAQLLAKDLPLPTWRFRTDPDDQGRGARWFQPNQDLAAAPWRDLPAGKHWENFADDLKHYTGIAWYCLDVVIPADWAGQTVRAVFEGIDDSGELWVDGEPVAAFGDAATKTSIWLQRQVADLGTRLPPGPHRLALRVVDHAGAGGLWKPVRLTTGPADERAPLLH